jgi:hypothetical protein
LLLPYQGAVKFSTALHGCEPPRTLKQCRPRLAEQAQKSEFSQHFYFIFTKSSQCLTHHFALDLLTAVEAQMKTMGETLRPALAVGLLSMSLLLAACGDSDGNNDSDLRVLHTSKDAPPVNVRVDNRQVISDLDYAAGSGYVEVRSGTNSVVVEAIIPGGNADVISVPALEFENNQRYNILAINDTATIDTLVVEESAAAPSSTEVAIAVVHASTNADAVDVYVTAPGALLNGSSPTFTFDYTDVVDAGALPAGLYQIRVALQGELDPDANAVYDSGTIDLSAFAGEKLLIAAISSVTDTELATSPIKLLAATDTANLVLVDEATLIGARVTHLSPDAGPVDVFANGAKLISDLEYTETFPSETLADAADPSYSDYANVPAGDYAFDVVAPASPTSTVGDSVYNAQLPLASGVDYSVIALGNVADGLDGPGNGTAFGLLPMIDENRAVVTQASVKILHAAPAAGDVDIYVTAAGDFSAADVIAGLAGDPLLDEFAFGDLTPYVTLAPGDYDIRVIAGGAAAINVEGLTLGPGLVATVIARQDEAPGPTPFGAVLLTN